MSSMRFLAILMTLIFLGSIPGSSELFSQIVSEQAIFEVGASVQVRYVYRSAGSRVWSHSNTTLKGTSSESMMQNQIASRHSGAEVRVLSARVASKPVERLQVRYQFRNEKSQVWSFGNATVQDALTENMIRNQLMDRHPNCEVRILGVSR